MRSVYRRVVAFDLLGNVVSAVDIYRHDRPAQATRGEDDAALVPPDTTDVTPIVPEYPTLEDIRRANRVEITAALTLRATRS